MVDLRGEYNADDFSFLDLYINNKWLTVKIKVGLSPSKKMVLFASIEGLLEWWKILFFSF